jgi:Lon protease-like protein
VAATDRYRRPADLPPRIPVFPLTGAILLPRATLPLNIFEPRYLAMLDDVVGGARILGMIQPERTDGAEESPEGKTSPLKRVGCAGRVTAYQELDDGRLLITLTGIARFAVLRPVDTAKPYRVCEVSFDTYETDFAVDATAGDVDRQGLLKVVKSYLDTHRLRADWKAIAEAPTEFLINALSVVSPFGPEEKQALLEAANLKARAEVLVALAEMEMAAGDGGTGSTLQ